MGIKVFRLYRFINSQSMKLFLLIALTVVFANFCVSLKLASSLEISKFVSKPVFPPFSQSSLVCEGKSLKIKCKGSENIKIYSVFYGRTNHNTCPSKWNKFPFGGCVSKTAPAIVKNNCNGKSSCLLVASNFALGGDPCVGTYKYLTVTWGCEQKCNVYWTKFYDRDNPSGKGDWETINDLRNQYPGQTCDNPIAVEGRLTNGSPISVSGNYVELSTTAGLICRNNQQTNQLSKYCKDFKVRFLCIA